MLTKLEESFNFSKRVMMRDMTKAKIKKSLYSNDKTLQDSENRAIDFLSLNLLNKRLMFHVCKAI